MCLFCCSARLFRTGRNYANARALAAHGKRYRMLRTRLPDGENGAACLGLGARAALPVLFAVRPSAELKAAIAPIRRGLPQVSSITRFYNFHVIARKSVVSGTTCTKR